MNFEELFRQVYPGLLRYCHRMTGDADAAEDAAQEAFVRLLDRRVGGDPPGLRAWLFKVATHLIRDRARVEANRARLLEATPLEGGRSVEPDEALEQQRRIERVRAALVKLEERDRTLLLMREEGFAYRELAAAVGVEVGSVGTLLARARRKFNEAMGAFGEPKEEETA